MDILLYTTLFLDDRPVAFLTEDAKPIVFLPRATVSAAKLESNPALVLLPISSSICEAFWIITRYQLF